MSEANFLAGQEAEESKTIRLLEKKLHRSEVNRIRLEGQKDIDHSMLRNITREIEDAHNLIEKKNQELESLYLALHTEAEKSEQLLLSILPQNVAKELKEKGRVEPVLFESATVIFTDFEGFTRVAAGMSPRKLVEEIDFCFSEFDRIIDRHALERLKTIGDSYMCVGGISESSVSTHHAIRAVRAALEIRDFIAGNIERKQQDGLPSWRVRIGLHTGPVVAGVVGSRKFAYDIWGDTVNIASRMESNGEPGRVNVSKDTMELVKDRFLCESRGQLYVKNRGEMEMFFADYINKGERNVEL